MKKILIIGSQGYIGSTLTKYLKEKDYNLTLVDSLHRKSDVDNFFIQERYQDLEKSFLDSFSDCIWLAGHSSVAMSQTDSSNALKNNFYDLIKFYKKLNGRFIYASTGSVYSRDNVELCDETALLASPQNTYDYSKLAFDNYLISHNLPAVALRFGTVNGLGLNIKKELMINSMVKSYKSDGFIKLNNLNFYRPILWMKDLIFSIENILESNINKQIFNLCSFNSSIGDIGQRVAKILDCEMRILEDTPTYNFKMSNEKFSKLFSYEFQGSLEKIVEELINYDY